MRFLRDLDNQLFDVLCRVPEHLRSAGVAVFRIIDHIGRRLGVSPIFQRGDHARNTLAAEAGLGVEDLLQNGELFLLNCRNLFLHRERFALCGEITFPMGV